MVSPVASALLTSIWVIGYMSLKHALDCMNAEYQSLQPNLLTADLYQENSAVSPYGLKTTTGYVVSAILSIGQP
ncbi:MAG: hypothetical protein OJF52_003957 [Nitrospira sp.]|jgi:hypothetical protein|nr:MAG: hypothetical protein OJF52_003957 [Nitrospira sp.]